MAMKNWKNGITDFKELAYDFFIFYNDLYIELGKKIYVILQ